ncbi:DMT family transporter [bacterium]|nr:DMT family transporter [bacterium]
MIWITYAFSSVAFFVVLNLLSKVLMKDSKDTRAFAFIFNCISAAFALTIFIASSGYKNLPDNYSTIALTVLLISSLSYGLFERFKWYAIKHTEISVNTVIVSLATPLAFLSAIFLYNESINVYKVVGTVLVVIAVFFTTSRAKGKSTTKGLLTSFFTMALIAVAWSFDKMGSQLYTPEFFNILVWTFPILFIVFPKIKIQNIKIEWKINNYKIVLISFLNVIGYYLNLKALQIAEATRVIPIIESSVIITVIAGVFLLKEKDSLSKKIIAAILSFVGIILLTFR